VANTPTPLAGRVKKEALLFLALLFFGFVIMPIGIWFVGKAVFGEYGGAGYADFFGNLSAKIRAGDTVAWFLVLSPWIVWQILRLAAFGWRAAAKL
jgi:hypothetical protein